MSREQTLTTVLKNLSNSEAEIRQVLPADLPYERFVATTQQALLQFPQILDCTPNSLTQACMKAAYDGLRIDGREAAIVERKQKQKGRNQGRQVKLAQYMPMAFGLVQQIYRGGEVEAMEVDVVYEGDEYHIQKGTNPGIHHAPNVQRPKGAKILAAYSIATLKGGHKTFEVLGMADLAEIKAAASYDAVWNAWPGEMSKKSAVRRHRKMLPLGDRDIVDTEQSDMYEMERQPALAKPTGGNQTPARPRRLPEEITHEPQSVGGVSLDLNDDREGVTIDAKQQGGEEQRLRNDTSNEGENLKRTDADGADDDDDLDARIDAAMEEAGDET